jgi:hypothetical protein
MKIQQLDTLEMAKYGATHKAVISFADGDFTAAATSQSYTIAALGARDKIANVFTRVPTFLSGGAVSAAAIVVGDDDDADGFVTTSSVFTAGVNGRAGDGAYFNQAGGRVYTGAKSLIVALTTTTANVSTLTAGEIHVFFSLSNIGNV